jgi:uncharacterized coiled-coil protein SlyX
MCMQDISSLQFDMRRLEQKIDFLQQDAKHQEMIIQGLSKELDQVRRQLDQSRLTPRSS